MPRRFDRSFIGVSPAAPISLGATRPPRPSAKPTLRPPTGGTVMALFLALTGWGSPQLHAIALAIAGLLTGLTIVRMPHAIRSLRARALAPAFSRRLSRWVKSLDYQGDD